MNISVELSDQIEFALAALARHPEHRLTLTRRAYIWKAFGPRLTNEEGTTRAIGLRRRTALASLCVRQVLYLWEETLYDDREPHLMLATAKQVLNQSLDRAIAWDRMNAFWARLEQLLGTDELKWVTDVGCAAANALKVALCDEAFNPEYIGEIEGDREEGLYDWDAALFACLAYCREGYFDESVSKPLRKEFWEWYIKEAVPAAYQAPI